MTDNRPLWRVGTKALISELERRKEAESVQRAMLSEAPNDLLIAECHRRGWVLRPMASHGPAPAGMNIVGELTVTEGPPVSIRLGPPVGEEEG